MQWRRGTFEINIRHVECLGLGNKLGAWEKGKQSIFIRSFYWKNRHVRIGSEIIDKGSQLATGFNLEHKTGFACVNLRQRCLVGTYDHISENEK